MHALLLVFHVLSAVGLIALVLLQHGKGADAGAAFGSGASSTVFGSRGAGSFLSRATAVLATLFFVISLALAILANRQPEEGSVTDLPGSAVTETPAEGVADGRSDVPAPEDVPAAGDQSGDVPTPAPVEEAAPSDATEGGN